jgi:hypothetical protein
LPNGVTSCHFFLFHISQYYYLLHSRNKSRADYDLWIKYMFVHKICTMLQYLRVQSCQLHSVLCLRRTWWDQWGQELVLECRCLQHLGLLSMSHAFPDWQPK